MLNIIKGIFLTLFRNIAKFFITLKNLAINKFEGKNDLRFPFTIRGNGKIRSRGNLRLDKNIFWFVMGKLDIGENCSFLSQSIINVGRDANLRIGHTVLVEKGVVLSVKQNNWEIGAKVYMSEGSTIFSRENEVEGVFEIGEASNLSNNCTLDVTGDLIIGKKVAIAHNCSIFTHDHDYMDNEVCAWKGDMKVESVTIEDGAWIGAHVVILPGVTIGKKSVIAAGSVVTKSVPDFSLYGGNPAKLLKNISN